jgi:AcrR family transcriptional regulator
MATKVKSAGEPSQDRGAKARETLVLAALDLFASKGFDAASTRDIAKKSGQNIAAIPYYFGNKEGLYFAALEKGMQLMPHLDDNIRAVEAVLDNPRATPEDYLAAIVAWVRGAALSLAAQNRHTDSFMRLMLREQFSPSTAFRNAFQKVMVPKHDIFIQLVARYLNLRPADEETFFITHALMGGFFAFRLMPELVLQKTGLKKIGEKEAAMIAGIVTEQVEAAARALRARRMEASDA